MSNNKKEEFDQEVSNDGFIVPYEEKKRNKTQLCVPEEDALQICVLNNRGLVGCEKELEKYNDCRMKEFSKNMKDEQKQLQRRYR
ncbi:hypothetical protein ABK040_006231 [Willaertia magna]